MNAFVAKVLENLCECGEIFDDECGGGGSSRVFVRFEEEDDDNVDDGFNSQTLFGRVVYSICSSSSSSSDDDDDDGGERVSAPLMLKTMPSVPLLKDLALLQFSNEISFYTIALPVLQQLGDLQQQLLPKFYVSQTMLSARTKSSAIVLEDLRARGFLAADKHSFLDVDHLTLMLRKLGNFHAYSYRLKAENPLEFQALGKWFYDAHDLAPERLPDFFSRNAQRGVRRLRQDPRYSSRVRGIERIVENADEFMATMKDVPERGEGVGSVLCHGDYVRRNVMFRYDERSGKPCDLKMVDMAGCRVASPVVDLSTVLYLNADQPTRNGHWHRLIDAYHRGLCEAFAAHAAVPSREAVVDELRAKAAYAYIVASYFLPSAVASDRPTETFSRLLADQRPPPPPPPPPPHQQTPDTIFDSAAGEEGAQALVNILQDLIDCGFV